MIMFVLSVGIAFALDFVVQFQKPYSNFVRSVYTIYLWIWNNKSKKEYVRKYIIVYGSVIGLVFVYGVVMFHFAGNSDKSIRIAGVTVPISELLNNDEDVYSTFYTNTFTDENITNARSKLSSAADELFLKTELEAQAGAKIVFWSELNGAVLK